MDRGRLSGLLLDPTGTLESDHTDQQRALSLIRGLPPAAAYEPGGAHHPRSHFDRTSLYRTQAHSSTPISGPTVERTIAE